MTVYFRKDMGKWAYTFKHQKKRHSASGFKTKREAQRAEAQRKEDIRLQLEDDSPTTMAFEELILKRMDHIKSYKSWWYHQKHRFMARRWLECWGHLECRQITKQTIKDYLKSRKEDVSANAANKDLRHLRACFNWGKTELNLTINPTEGIEYFPIKSACLMCRRQKTSTRFSQWRHMTNRIISG